ncbi:MAG: hypothetical protein WBN83_02275 [Desulfoprunum sp.]|uniref:hypothetical protein n=1 Tax=Desulfoprunum sp. TaxID=2020866 RepID=UPI003C73A2EE
MNLPAGPDDHIAALSPIAAIGPPLGNVFFPAKTHTAITAIAGFDKKFRFIDEGHDQPQLNNMNLISFQHKRKNSNTSSRYSSF